MLGKVNMESRWCTWCSLSANEWQENTTHPIELWDLQSYGQKLREVLVNPRMNASNKKGVVKEPILGIDPSLFVIPALHAKLGLVN